MFYYLGHCRPKPLYDDDDDDGDNDDDDDDDEIRL